MIFPIPSRCKRISITLRLVATRPVVIGLLVHDPGKPYTDYFRRKVSFRASCFKNEGTVEREIKIPLPVSPEKAVLEVYNKTTGDDKGTRVEGLKIEPLPGGESWASPEQHRFMEFAIRFAQKAGYARAGFYHSPNHEFLIQYLPAITDQYGKELVTPARIHRKMPRVQLSQKLFRQFSIPVRVAILSHEGAHFFYNTRSETKADMYGIRYYLDYGFPSIEAVYAATKVFMLHPASIGQEHLKRTRDIVDLIDKHKANQSKKQIA